MNDRYLFRGKRKYNGEWVEGFYYKDLWSDNAHYIIYDGTDYEVIPETVGQYTGLTDNNGKRIFEGDVVEAYDDAYVNGFAEVKGKVFFNYGSFDINVEDVGYASLYAYETENIEVIGNIHDNPDLLKGE